MSAEWHRGVQEMEAARLEARVAARLEARDARQQAEQKHDDDFDSQATTQEYEVEQEYKDPDETDEEPTYSPTVSPMPVSADPPPLEAVAPVSPLSARRQREVVDLTVSSDEEFLDELVEAVQERRKKRRKLTADQRYRKRKAYNKKARERKAAL